MIVIALLQALQDHRAHQAALNELSALSASIITGFYLHRAAALYFVLISVI